MQETPLPRRKEFRVPLKTFVNLSEFDKPSYEIASTIDISSHGARVLTKKSWKPNQDVSVRSIRGTTLNSRARVVHCKPYTNNIFVIGIEFYAPIGDWTGYRHSGSRGEMSDAFRAQLVFVGEVFRELFDLLEAYAPLWYTAEHHNRAVDALRVFDKF